MPTIDNKVRADLAAPSAPAEVEGLVELKERLEAGVIMEGLHDDNNTELFDVEDANETMFEAATTLTALQAENERLRAECDYDRRQSDHKSTVIDRANALATEADLAALAEMLDAETRACAEMLPNCAACGGSDAILARLDQRKESHP